MDYDAWCRLLSDQRLPCAVVDLGAFDRNVRRFAEVVSAAGHEPGLRIATKSLRVPELIRRVVDFGPPYRGLMCYATEETEFLMAHGFDDLLIAYPTIQPSDLEIVRKVHMEGCTVRLVLDSAEQLARVSDAMSGVDRPFPVVLDVDLSLRLVGGRLHVGVRRSPLRTVAEMLALWDAAATLPDVEPVGLMGYEAQVAGLGDRNPFRNRLTRPIIRWIRGRSVRQAAETRRKMAEAIGRRGDVLQLFNGGGTGSITYAAREPHLTELTVGSGFLCPHLFDYYSNIQPEPACFFALQVCRSSDPGFVTCAGGGYLASGEVGQDKAPVPYLPAGLQQVSTEGFGEVQTPLRLPTGMTLPLGAPVLFRHAKAGELAEHFREYLLVEDGRVIGRAPTYRGCGECFL